MLRSVLFSMMLAACLGRVAESQTDSLTPPVPADSIAGDHTDSVSRFAQPVDVAPQQGRWMCRNRSKTSCILYGAFFGAALGYIVSDLTSPKPEYGQPGLLYGGSILGGETCVANCVPRNAFVFTLSGSALGALGGWLLSRD
jgi:hypothetical protein